MPSVDAATDATEQIPFNGEPLALTKAQVARLLQVGEGTVETLHRTRQLTAVPIGRHLRWRKSDIEDYVHSLKGDDDD